MDALTVLRADYLNPAHAQALVEGAEQLPKLGMFEQGSGKVSLAGSRQVWIDVGMGQ